MLDPAQHAQLDAREQILLLAADDQGTSPPHMLPPGHHRRQLQVPTGTCSMRPLNRPPATGSAASRTKVAQIISRQ